MLDLTLRCRKPALLAAVRDGQLEQIELAHGQAERVTAIEQYDARSDAHLWRAYALARAIEQDPAEAVPLARLIREHIVLGLELDEQEMEHARAIRDEAGQIQTIGHCCVGLIDARFGVKGPGPGPEAA